ncbi:MAG TPA: outer membrane protein assembly factor BamD [Candidatus Babeliales bacterium]|nr:outer membrane protein assembly factor BamD [Candidatus Babeliales bacterium]
MMPTVRSIYRYLFISLAIFGQFYTQTAYARRKKAEPTISAVTKEFTHSEPAADAPESSTVETPQQSWWSWITSERKTVKNMNYQELKEAKNRSLKDNNKSNAIKYAEQMLKLCNDLHEQRIIMLELADLYFDTDSFESAGKLYKEFLTYFSGSDKAEYANYQAIQCSFFKKCSSNRDQSKTHETIELAETFLKRSDLFTTYRDQVQTMLNQCREQLLESELNIANFYTTRGQYASATKRIENIRKDFLPTLAHCEHKILTTECVLAQQTNNVELLTIKQAELTKLVPPTMSTITVAQANESTDKPFSNRF